MKKISLLAALMFVCSVGALAQLNPGGPLSPAGILFSENFNGITNLPPGWTEYVEDSWDMILPQNDEVIFFKQSTGVKKMILSTPSIDLTNASQLTFMFSSKLVVSTLKVGVMSDPLNPATFQQITQFQVDTAMILYTVPLGTVTGITHLAFNWVGTYFKSAYLDDVIVYDNATQNNVPSNVTNALLTPDPNGASSAVLSWINPALEADGDPLTDLDSIRVMLNGSYYATVMNPPVGMAQTLPVTVPVPALYSATLTPFNTTGEGIPNTTPETWVGLDVPSAPNPVILTQAGNLATLSWSPPKTGMHGGYFNGTITKYTITRADHWQITAPGTDSTLVMNVTDPGTFNYTVVPENTSGNGPAGTSNTGVFLTGNYLLWEDFWVSVPAHLWTVQGENEYNWWLMNSNTAGGNPPELYFQSTSPNFTGYSRMASPPLNTSGKQAVTLEFRHAHTAYGPYLLKVETSSDDGSTWHTALSIQVAPTMPPEKKTVVLTTEDVGASNFRFALTFEGSEANVESFAIDEVRLFPTTGTDVSANAILLPEIIRPADVLTPQAVIQSLGADAAPYKATCIIRDHSGTVVYTDSLTSTVFPGGTDTLSFQNLPIPEGEFQSRVFLRCSLDENPLNDTVIREFVAYKTYTRGLVILEEATGTWCTYCPGASMGIEDLIAQGLAVAAIAYHGGDNYETPESQGRINYYPAITGFPTVMFDGVLSYVGGTHSTSMHSDYLPLVNQRLGRDTPVKVSIQGADVSTGTLHADVSVESLSPINSDRLVLHAMLTESGIPEAWQDQDTLNEVERASFADSTGLPVNLADRTETVSVDIQLNASWEQDALRLVVFVQDKVTREIFNGDIMKPVTGIAGTEPGTIRLYPNPASSGVYLPFFDHASLSVYDMTGGLRIQEKEITGRETLDVSGLEPGLYLVRILEKGKVFTARIQVAR